MVAPKKTAPPKIDGAKLLDEVEAAIRKYVVLPSEADYVGATIYAAYTHAFQAFEIAPMLVITSVEPQCGKSTLMDILGRLSLNHKASGDMSPASLARSIRPDNPQTFVLEEMDGKFGTTKMAEQNEPMRALINSCFDGHTYDRFNTRTQQNESYGGLAPVIVGAIGEVPKTWRTRGVKIRIRRKARTDKSIERFRRHIGGVELKELSDVLTDWLQPQVEDIKGRHLDIPEMDNDRDEDLWEPLLIVASLAGTGWADKARAAAIEIANKPDYSTPPIGNELLKDCREVFSLVVGDFVETSTLLDLLKSKEESPWREYGRDGLSAKKMGELLDAYEIHSRPNRQGKRRGYYLHHFDDAFMRYLPPLEQSVKASNNGADQ